MRSWKVERVIANTLTMWAIRLGISRPPYTRRNALIVETIGRRSGKRRRIPVGYLEDDGKLIVVAEDGDRADWVRNALWQNCQLRIYHRGKWRSARLSLPEQDPEVPLQRMNKLHAALVRMHSTAPQVVEITPE